jgi:hypothetical protein
MSTVMVGPLRQRMIEDMNARQLCAGTQRGHVHSCKRFAAFLKRSPDTATAEDIRRFQLHLSEGASICNRNRIMTGLRFLFRVTLRRLDLAAEIYHGGFHRIRHYGLLASGSRAANIARARQLLAVPVRSEQQDTSEAPAADEPRMLPQPCPGCGGRMFIIETFARGSEPKHRPTPAPAAIRIDTS